MNLQTMKQRARERLQTAGADGFAVDLDLDELDSLIETAYNAGLERAVEVEWYLGKKVNIFGGDYIVVGLSQMIYDEDCEGEPEWKITKEIQEVAIAEPFEDYSFQKPSWHTVTKLRTQLQAEVNKDNK